MREEDIEAFIAELHDAEPFTRPKTTAVDLWRSRSEQPGAVDGWIKEALERCLRRYYLDFPADPPFGAAVIEGRSRGRLFEQSPCETGSWFLGRLRTEATASAEPWVFVMVPQVRDVASRMYQDWAPGCEPRPFTLSWYFEARGRGRASRLWGNVRLTDRDALLWSVDFSEPPRDLDDILRGHPARRRHQIRNG